MTVLLPFLMISQLGGGGNFGLLEMRHSSGLPLTLNNDINLCFGTSSNICLRWDSGNSRWESAGAGPWRWEDASANAMMTLTDSGTTGTLTIGTASMATGLFSVAATTAVFQTGTDNGAAVLQGLGNANGEVNAWVGSNYSDAQSGNLSTLLAVGTDVDNSTPARVQKWAIKRDGLERHTVQSVTCADNGAGTNAALTITPNSSYIEVTSADANGCDVTMSETNMEVGDVTTICVISVTAGAVNFADTAGVTELAGAFASNVDDCLTLRYGNTTTWREVSRSAN